MKNSKTWSILAAVAIICSAGAGLAAAHNNEDEPTHYNARSLSDPIQTPIWEPIVDGEMGSQGCDTENEPSRECKAIKLAENIFQVVAYGELEDL